MQKQQRRLLLIEDEVKIVEAVAAYLESKGFTVAAAANGAQGLALFEREGFCLVLLDLMLPDMSGESICSTIRRKSRVPIIMLTAKAEEEDMLKGLQIGADDYIIKPFSLKALHARIQAVLRRAGDDLMPLFSKNAFQEGDLEIDFESRTIKKRQALVNLTPNEFQILAALVKYPNKVFTREELIEIALGDSFDGFSRAVDNHIKNLRHKIETDPKHPVYVVTVHGVGYKFGG